MYPTRNNQSYIIVTGLSMSVVRNGHTVLTEGFGFADIESGVSATKDTQFCLASLTKAFTATLLGDILNKQG